MRDAWRCQNDITDKSSTEVPEALESIGGGPGGGFISSFLGLFTWDSIFAPAFHKWSQSMPKTKTYCFLIKNVEFSLVKTNNIAFGLRHWFGLGRTLCMFVNQWALNPSTFMNAAGLGDCLGWVGVSCFHSQCCPAEFHWSGLPNSRPNVDGGIIEPFTPCS